MKIFFSLIFLFIFYLASQELIAKTDLSGYSKLTYFKYKKENHPKNSIKDLDADLLLQANRVTFLRSLRPNIYFEASYELLYLYQDDFFDDENFELNFNENYRMNDLPKVIIQNEPYSYVLQNLDRIFFTLESENSILNLGRQPISMGSAKVVNPTDIFVPLSYTDLDGEERLGVDSLRYRKSFINSQELDFILSWGENGNLDQSALFLSYYISNDKNELKTMVSSFKKAWLLGLDFTQNIWESQFVIESAWVKPQNEPSYLRTIIGWRKIWNADLTFFIEYYYNEAGLKPEISDVLKDSVLISFAYSEGQVEHLYKEYLFTGFTYQVGPLDGLNLMIQYSKIEKNSLFHLSWQKSLSDSMYFLLGFQYTVGGYEEKEFGQLPNSYFTQIRFYY